MLDPDDLLGKKGTENSQGQQRWMAVLLNHKTSCTQPFTTSNDERTVRVNDILPSLAKKDTNRDNLKLFFLHPGNLPCPFGAKQKASGEDTSFLKHHARQVRARKEGWKGALRFALLKFIFIILYKPVNWQSHDLPPAGLEI